MATFGTNVTAQAWAVLEQVGAVTSGRLYGCACPDTRPGERTATAAGQPYTVDMLLRAFRRTEMDGVAVVAGPAGPHPERLLAVTPTRETVTRGDCMEHCRSARRCEWCMVANDFATPATGLREGTCRELTHIGSTALAHPAWRQGPLAPDRLSGRRSCGRSAPTRGRPVAQKLTREDDAMERGDILTALTEIMAVLLDKGRDAIERMAAAVERIQALIDQIEATPTPEPQE